MAKTNVFIASRTEQENYILQKKLESLEQDFTDIKFSSLTRCGTRKRGRPSDVGRDHEFE